MPKTLPLIMIGKWDAYHKVRRFFGNDDATYRKAAEWLGGRGLVEDWGCGCRWADQFFPEYRGVDGSGPFADVRADLALYQSSVPCALMRHVLEHDYRWRFVLQNFLASFTDRACIILFTPLVDVEQHGIAIDDIPNINLPRTEFMQAIAPYLVSQESVGEETVFYLEAL